MSRSPLESAIPAGRTEKKSKRGIFYTALLGVAGLGAASSVFAASITLNSGDPSISFSQGTQTIAACDTDGITASLDSAFSTTADPDAFVWTEITLDDVDAGCNDKAIDIQVWDSSGLLVTITGTVVAASDGQTLSVGAGTPANGIVAQAAIAHDANPTDTWTGIDGTLTLAYETGKDAVDVAADGSRLLIEIN